MWLGRLRPDLQLLISRQLHRLAGTAAKGLAEGWQVGQDGVDPQRARQLHLAGLPRQCLAGGYRLRPQPCPRAEELLALRAACLRLEIYRVYDGVIFQVAGVFAAVANPNHLIDVNSSGLWSGHYHRYPAVFSSPFRGMVIGDGF